MLRPTSSPQKFPELPEGGLRSPICRSTTRRDVVSGSLARATVPGLRERLPGACHSPVRQLPLDLSGVTCCDTLGLAALSRAVVGALSDSGPIRLLRVLPDAGAAAGTTAVEALLHRPGSAGRTPRYIAAVGPGNAGGGQNPLG
ncbi:STAS domain-containing protein [Streptomyces sp. NPDC021056]|uniref:STAS domain-containing protein n=1 Tax=Streptomyces sp. NPDC021056 TaxID=3155012 RepID=UPI0033D95C05